MNDSPSYFYSVMLLAIFVVCVVVISAYHIRGSALVVRVETAGYIPLMNTYSSEDEIFLEVGKTYCLSPGYVDVWRGVGHNFNIITGEEISAFLHIERLNGNRIVMKPIKKNTGGSIPLQVVANRPNKSPKLSRFYLMVV